MSKFDTTTNAKKTLSKPFAVRAVEVLLSERKNHQTTPPVNKSYTENQNLKLYRERKSESEREINPNFLSLSLLLLLASTGPGLEFHS